MMLSIVYASQLFAYAWYGPVAVETPRVVASIAFNDPTLFFVHLQLALLELGAPDGILHVWRQDRRIERHMTGTHTVV